MNADKEIIKEAIGQTEGVLEKAYDDIAHPTAKSLGNTLSLIPRTVGVWLSKWEKWVINGEESIKLTAEAVREKASKIPEEKLTEPEPYVAVPAIQQLSYCYDCEELREMYANLLVSSMNTDTKYTVHPAFVDIIKQLCPDEAKLLKLMSHARGALPLVDLEIILPQDQGKLISHRNFTNIGENICTAPEHISEYLENLDRVKIISISETRFIPDPIAYKAIEASPVLSKYMQEKLPADQKYNLKKKAFFITDFGSAFIKTCVE